MAPAPDGCACGRCKPENVQHCPINPALTHPKDMLKEAIRSGDNDRIDETFLREMRRQHAILRQTQARAQVDDAFWNDDDDENLIQACSQAEIAGISPRSDYIASQLLRTRTHVYAKADLKDAMRTGSIQRIEQSCVEAENVGLERYQLVRAKEKAFDLRRIRARQELEDALLTSDVDRIEESCRNAKKNFVSMDIVTDAWALALRMRAIVDLRKAVKSGDPVVVSKALSYGQDVEIDRLTVESATYEMRRLQRLQADVLAALEVEKNKVHKTPWIHFKRCLDGQDEFRELCQHVIDAGLSRAWVEAKWVVAQTLRAESFNEVRLREAVQQGDYWRLCAALQEAEADNVEPASLAKAQAEADRLRSCLMERPGFEAVPVMGWL